jgi:uncharacterized alkaline shock family protein YloU
MAIRGRKRLIEWRSLAQMNENLGRVTIAPDVLVTIARLTTQSVEGVAHLCHQFSPGKRDRLLGRVAGSGGVHIAVTDDTVCVDLYIIVEPDANMRSISQKIQEAVTRAIQDMVGMKASAVNIHIQDVAFSRRSS